MGAAYIYDISHLRVNVGLVVVTCDAADIPQDVCGNVLQLNVIYCPHSYRNGVVTKWVIFIYLFIFIPVS